MWEHSRRMKHHGAAGMLWFKNLIQVEKNMYVMSNHSDFIFSVKVIVVMWQNPVVILVIKQFVEGKTELWWVYVAESWWSDISVWSDVTAAIKHYMNINEDRYFIKKVDLQDVCWNNENCPAVLFLL